MTILKNYSYLIVDRKILKTYTSLNKEECYSLVPQISDTRYSANGDMQAAKGVKIDSSHISVTLL